MKAKFMLKQVPQLARRWTIKQTELFTEILAQIMVLHESRNASC